MPGPEKQPAGGRRPLCRHQKQPGQPLSDPAQRRRGEMRTAEDGGKD